jgi:3-hydroxy acid dehydrogenase/malonic semialdehyde reductase
VGGAVSGGGAVSAGRVSGSAHFAISASPRKIHAMSRLSLKDRIVLITGASSGIGEATARAFAAEGARLILAARRKDRLDKLAAELGVPCLALKLDVTKRREVEAALSNLPAEWSDVDILVNNAGLALGAAKYQDYDLDHVDAMFDANVKGLLYCTRLILPGMIARNRGHVINMGSVAGHYAYQNGTVYCATKAAVKTITEALKQDLLGTPVRITSIDPGMVETEFSVVRYGGDAERAKKVYENMQPMSGDDIAEMIVFAATRPAHININFMVIMSTYQSTPMTVYRGELGKKQ